MKEQCKKLQELMHREVPLAKLIGMRVAACDEDTLTLLAPLEPNINIHGTAFGGSLFSLAALAGWGLLQLKLSRGGEPENMVLGHARIAYHLPVRGEITVRCKLPAGDKFQSFIDDFHEARKARIKMVSEIITQEGAVASLSGFRVAWKRKLDA